MNELLIAEARDRPNYTTPHPELHTEDMKLILRLAEALEGRDKVVSRLAGQIEAEGKRARAKEHGGGSWVTTLVEPEEEEDSDG